MSVKRGPEATPLMVDGETGSLLKYVIAVRYKAILGFAKRLCLSRIASCLAMTRWFNNLEYLI
jgi:hypothetical protein